MNCIITDVQRFSVHDGPGVRTTVFFKGCPLRCVWCHNPETNLAFPQTQFNGRKCVLCGRCEDICKNGCHSFKADGDGRPCHIFDSADCSRCFECVDVCPCSALEISGKERDTDEIMETVLRDRAFYGSKGGITLSGGEPTMQYEAANDLLYKAKKAGISTCLESCGYYLDKIDLSLCDLIYFDIKSVDTARHKELTGVSNERILFNLRTASAVCREKIVIRSVIAVGYTDQIGHTKALRALADECGIEKVELLAFHPYGASKADAVGICADHIGKEAVPSDELMEQLRRSAIIS